MSCDAQGYFVIAGFVVWVCVMAFLTYKIWRVFA